LVFNADLTVNADKTNEGDNYTQTLENPMFWGLSLAAGYQATDLFGLAIRGEYLSDSDNQLFQVLTSVPEFPGVTFPSTQETNVVTVTGTLDFKPVHGSNNLIIRWDNRIETSNEDIYFNRSSEESNVWFGSILGVVVTTDS
jgi:Putative beta-barrel porin-2, OmpL-like. bbp2